MIKLKFSKKLFFLSILIDFCQSASATIQECINAINDVNKYLKEIEEFRVECENFKQDVVVIQDRSLERVTKKLSGLDQQIKAPLTELAKNVLDPLLSKQLLEQVSDFQKDLNALQADQAELSNLKQKIKNSVNLGNTSIERVWKKVQEFGLFAHGTKKELQGTNEYETALIKLHELHALKLKVHMLPTLSSSTKQKAPQKEPVLLDYYVNKEFPASAFGAKGFSPYLYCKTLNWNVQIIKNERLHKAFMQWEKRMQSYFHSVSLAPQSEDDLLKAVEVQNADVVNIFNLWENERKETVADLKALHVFLQTGEAGQKDHLDISAVLCNLAEGIYNISTSNRECPPFTGAIQVPREKKNVFLCNPAQVDLIKSGLNFIEALFHKKASELKANEKLPKLLKKAEWYRQKVWSAMNDFANVGKSTEEQQEACDQAMNNIARLYLTCLGVSQKSYMINDPDGMRQQFYLNSSANLFRSSLKSSNPGILADNYDDTNAQRMNFITLAPMLEQTQILKTKFKELFLNAGLLENALETLRKRYNLLQQDQNFDYSVDPQIKENYEEVQKALRIVRVFM